MATLPLWFGPFCAFLSSCTWAVGSVRYAKISQGYSPFSINLTRALIALPLFVVTAFVMAGGIGSGLEQFSMLGSRHLGWFTLSMICSYGVADVLFLWSTRSLGVPGALAIASSYPLITAIGEAIGTGRLLDLSQLAGLCLVVGGVMTVILHAPDRVATRAPTTIGEKLTRRNAGVVLALITAVLWAGNSFAVSRGGADIPPAVGNCVRMALAIGISLLLSRLIAPGKPFVLPGAVMTRGTFAVFLLEAFGGSMFFMYGLANSPLVIATALTSLAPVISVPIAWALRLERISWPRTLGVGLVVCGLWLLAGPGA